MRVYGVTTAKRSPLPAGCATIAESGVEGYEFGNWHGLFAPSGPGQVCAHPARCDPADFSANRRFAMS